MKQIWNSKLRSLLKKSACLYLQDLDRYEDCLCTEKDAELTKLSEDLSQKDTLIRDKEKEVEELRKNVTPTELWLCESHRLILRPETLYVFNVDPSCKKCREMEDTYKQEQLAKEE